MFAVEEMDRSVFRTESVGRVPSTLLNAVRSYRWAELAGIFKTIGGPPLKLPFAGCDKVTTAGRPWVVTFK